MKLGLLGDIHAEDERLASALRLFADERVDTILFVGDVADGHGDIDRCCALLTDTRAVGVRGNHDRWVLEGSVRSLPHAHFRENLAASSVALLESLPPVRDIDTTLGTLLLCHGVGESDMRRLTERDEGYALQTHDELAAVVRANRYPLVVGGHTHQRMVKRFRATDLGVPGNASLVFVNPGTLARDATPCCAVLDCEARAVVFFDLDDPAEPLESESVSLP